MCADTFYASDTVLDNNSCLDSAPSLPHLLFHGTTWHSRLLPSVHKFAYPYRYWGVNISALAAGQPLPEVGLYTDPTSATEPTAKLDSVKYRLLSRRLFANSRLNVLALFSAKHSAIQQFCPSDYLHQPDNEEAQVEQDKNKRKARRHINRDNKVSLQAANEQLLARLNAAFIEQTGSAPTGDMLGLVVCRNAGLYFSPVNFYLGFDELQIPSHLLAEVSNTPWDKRHYYGFLLQGADSEFCHDKNFHVSPFNPIDQQYCWQVSIKNTINDIKNSTLKNTAPRTNADSQANESLLGGLQVRIAINISDVRGEVLKTGIKMSGVPMSAPAVRASLAKNPLMNITSLTRIYWHALKLYAIKKVPYVGYDEKLADSKQR
ncbi:DUF1365 domain-containing protein [Psychrobacter urativorans]|uniref:DUF1365 domain-containing protein n=1 Tax=Psychrobacter urativorans TaxID=45610 RepID=UPI0019191B9C|nr:DUF1365 family protein [Psychrobacter urativorans]